MHRQFYTPLTTWRLWRLGVACILHLQRAGYFFKTDKRLWLRYLCINRLEIVNTFKVLCWGGGCIKSSKGQDSFREPDTCSAAVIFDFPSRERYATPQSLVLCFTAETCPPLFGDGPSTFCIRPNISEALAKSSKNIGSTIVRCVIVCRLQAFAF